MHITFLGTGTSQGVPVIACKCNVCNSNDQFDKRLRSSVMIEEQEITIVIDTGPDFREQMLRENVQQVDAILFTHEHRDHTAGLDDIRSFNFLSGHPMDVYAEERVINALKCDFSYIFATNHYPGAPTVSLHPIVNTEFTIKKISITPIRAMHNQLPVMGFRIGDFTYITDANKIEDNEKQKISGSKILVLSGLHKKKHESHFNLEEAVNLITEMKPQVGYITHISHNLGFYREIENELPQNIHLAYDGLKLVI